MIIDPEDTTEFKPLPPNTVGEICIFGPNVVSGGYWKNPEATKKSFFKPGWYRTGGLFRCFWRGESLGLFLICFRRFFRYGLPRRGRFLIRVWLVPGRYLFFPRRSLNLNILFRSPEGYDHSWRRECECAPFPRTSGLKLTSHSKTDLQRRRRKRPFLPPCRRRGRCRWNPAQASGEFDVESISWFSFSHLGLFFQGEEPAAVVQIHESYKGKVTESELRKHVASKIASFMVPVMIDIRTTELPYNQARKVLKRELRDEVTAIAKQRGILDGGAAKL